MKDDKRRWTESNRNKLPELLRWPKMFKCSLYIISNVELKTPLGASVLFQGSWIFILHYMYHDNCASCCSVVVLETIFLKYLQVNLFNPFGSRKGSWSHQLNNSYILHLYMYKRFWKYWHFWYSCSCEEF